VTTVSPPALRIRDAQIHQQPAGFTENTAAWRSNRLAYHPVAYMHIAPSLGGIIRGDLHHHRDHHLETVATCMLADNKSKTAVCGWKRRGGCGATLARKVRIPAPV
jgi:hypothetical protein